MDDNRKKIGTRTAVLAICVNLFLGVAKSVAGTLFASQSVFADGMNSLSDSLSAIVSLLAFRLSLKHPDHEHPYGHGRLEYVTGMMISLAVLGVGFMTLSSSVQAFLNGERNEFAALPVACLLISMALKTMLCMIQRKAGKQISSSTLMAQSKDSMSDIFISFAALLGYLSTLISDLPLDGLFGGFVSLFVIKEGVDLFKDTLSPLLGIVPDPEEINEIKATVLAHSEVLGIHDMMMHDYGPGRRFLVFHAELDAHRSLVEAHEIADSIERELADKYDLVSTVHLDPIDEKDPYTMALKIETAEVLKTVSAGLNFHDFRVVPGEKNTVLFDLVIPREDNQNHKDLAHKVCEAIETRHPECQCKITVEHDFI